jgi:hypothetical protein
MPCDFILRLAAIPGTPQSARLDTAGQRAPPDGSRLGRDAFWLNQHRALSFCLSMIFSENRCPLFRIML